MVKVLVMGGAGFIGREVVKYLEDKKHEVSIIDLKVPTKDLINDIRNDGWIYSPLDFDLVMIFAAVTSQLEFEEHPARSFKTNVHGLFNVLEACRRSKVPKVMFASSAAVYGDSMYGYSKLIGETMVEAYAKQGYFEGVSARLFNVYGPDEEPKGPYRSMVSYFAECKARKKVPVVYGDGRQSRDFIHVKDAARICFELCKARRTGVYDVGSGNSTSFNQIMDILGLMKRKYVVNPLKHYQYFTKADVSKITALGLMPEIGLEEGIRELIHRHSGSP